VVKRLKFEDLLQDQAEQDGGDEAWANWMPASP
jgi:DNA recombination-dependent growth factor C